MTHKPKVPRKRTKPARSGVSETARIRVRSKPLEKVDETKLALAFYLIAMQLVEDRTETAVGKPEGGGAAGDAA
jgi:hypothetical protein